MQSLLTIDKVFSLPKQRALSTSVWIGSFALLTAVGAQIIIPTLPVPFTLQTFFVLLSGALLGARKGAAAQLTYLTLGAIGLPVFAGFSGSILRFIGPTGGYLIAFPVAAFITGYLMHEARILRALPIFVRASVAMIAAMLCVFAFGVVHLNVMVFQNWNMSLSAGFLSLQVWDAVKILAAAGIASEVGKRFLR